MKSKERNSKHEIRKVKKQDRAAEDLLFEIGCEELPATNLADILESPPPGTDNSFLEKFKKTLLEERLSFSEAVVWATPRRLAFYAKNVSTSQTPRDQMTKVLSKDDSYGADGKPTEKILNILKHRGVSLADTVIADLAGKPFVYIRKAEPCEKAEKILPRIFETIVRSLHFPKNMKWDDSGLLFARPIRSCLGLFGNQPLQFKIGSTPSSASTRIFLKGRRVVAPVKTIPGYFKTLQKYGVILDQVRRKAEILSALESKASSISARLYDDPFLLSEINYLVEIPFVLTAPFGDEFLSLPTEVLTVSMARKQRIFGALGKKGELLPRLFAVLDGDRNAGQARVISGNVENILRAKLQDSLFFYREDSKRPLEKKREELKNLVFLKGAGSMLEKSERLVVLSRTLAADAHLPAEAASALERAAYLCKADLLTQMVGEFPELQGIMGKYYAMQSGESSETCAGIGEQYLPRTVADRVPESVTGAFLSVLDKCDLVTACFGVGLEPTSSLDPYGLRRSANAVFKIALDKKLDFSLRALLQECASQLSSYISQDRRASLGARLDAFFKDRFKAVLTDRGFREDLVDAVLATGLDRPYESYLRVEALSKILRLESFQKAQKIVERTANILKGVKEPLPTAIDPAVFTEELERELYAVYTQVRDSVEEALRRRDWAQATSLYGDAFFVILGKFFESVFINTDDARVRTNRLLLLKTVKELYTQNTAELSRIRA